MFPVKGAPFFLLIPPPTTESQVQLLPSPVLSTSHMNEIWERMIQSVHKTMKAILGNEHALTGLKTLSLLTSSQY